MDSPDGTKRFEGAWQMFDDTDGLVHECRFLLEDAEGCVWCGGKNGVSRYDGKQFITFKKTEGLPHNAISCMITDEAGCIWFGTNGGGLSRYDGMRFRNFGVAEGLAGDIVNCLCENGSGNVWAGTNGGLSRCDGETSVSFTALNGLPEGPVLCLFLDREEHLWIAAGDGICRYDGKRFEKFGSEDGWTAGAVRCFLQDRTGNIWIGKNRTGLSRYDGNRFSDFSADGSFVKDTVTCLLEDRAGNVWIGTKSKGVARFDGSRFTSIESRAGAKLHDVTWLLLDSAGNILAGTWGAGISRYEGRCFAPFIDRGMITVRSTNALEDREGGLWIACGHGGVGRYGPFPTVRISDKPVEEAMFRDRNGRFWWGTESVLTSFDGTSFEHHDMDGFIWALFEDSQGGFWVSTGTSLRRYESADGVGTDRFRKFPAENGQPPMPVLRIFEDTRKRLWFGTWSGGLVGYDGDRFSGPVAAKEMISAVCEDSAGLLWMGAWYARGISSFDGKSSRTYGEAEGLPANNTTCLVPDKAGNLWIGTTNGVSRFDGRSFRNYGTSDGLLGLCVQRMVVDSRGNLWIATLGGGIARFDGNCFQVLTVADGLPSNSVTGIIEQPDGTMVISTYGGVCRYEPDFTLRPSIRIDGVDPDGSAVEAGRVSAFQGTAVAIRYHSTSFRTKRMRYMYILEGHDTGWKTTWNEKVRYDSLPAGKYVFRVVAVNRDLVRSDPAEIALEVLPDPKERRLGELEMSVQDKTRQLESALEYSENILRVMNEALIIVSPDGVIMNANPAACAMLKCGQDKLVGTSMARIVEEDALPWDRPDPSAAPPQKCDRTLVAVDGTKILVQFSCSAMTNGGGRVAGFVCVAEDMTERRRMEQRQLEANRLLSSALAELKKMQQQAIQSERLSALGQMASGVAHDFNNALVPILGFSGLMLSNTKFFADKDQAMEMLKDIYDAAMQATDIVRRLRDFYRPADTSSFASLDINKVVETVVALTRPKWEIEMGARSKPITVKTELNEVPVILGSEPQLRDVLTNLVLNAVDAMPEGGTIAIRTGMNEKGLVVEVADNGTGMSEEVQLRCFEPFFTTKGGRGTGIGLSVVFGIVKAHKGTVELESRLGRGTTFRVHLPLTFPMAAAPESLETSKSLRPLRILIVDDEEWSRKFMVNCLEPDGHSISIACTGQEGLDAFRKGRLDLAIVDRALPDMSGDALALEIKRQSPDMPTVLVTGFGDLMKSAGVHPDGVDEILSKPMSKDELVASICRVVR